MILLTFRDLVYRKTRFIVVTVLGAVVFALLFVMTGLVNQFNLEPADTVEQFGADEWVLPEGVSAPFTSVSVMPAAALDAVDAETQVAGRDHPVERGRRRDARGGGARRLRARWTRGAAGRRGTGPGRRRGGRARPFTPVSTSTPRSPLAASRSPSSG